MTVDVAGSKPRVDGVRVTKDGNRVVIDGFQFSENSSVWDWKNWFNFSTDFRSAPTI